MGEYFKVAQRGEAFLGTPRTAAAGRSRTQPRLPSDLAEATTFDALRRLSLPEESRRLLDAVQAEPIGAERIFQRLPHVAPLRDILRLGTIERRISQHYRTPANVRGLNEHVDCMITLIGFRRRVTAAIVASAFRLLPGESLELAMGRPHIFFYIPTDADTLRRVDAVDGVYKQGDLDIPTRVAEDQWKWLQDGSGLIPIQDASRRAARAKAEGLRGG